MKKIYFIILFLAINSICLARLHWEKADFGLVRTPFTTCINNLTSIGSIVFCSASDSGVYISTNFGNSWKKANNGLDSYFVSVITSYGNDLFVGAFKEVGLNGLINPAIFYSNDSARTWIKKLALKNVDSLQSIWKIATNGKKIIATTITPYQIDSAIMFSDDYGNTWRLLRNEGFGRINDAIIKDSLIILGARGIFISSDNGNSWIESSIDKGTNVKITLSLLVKDSNIYAGVGERYYEQYIYVSSDNGKNWMPSGNGISKNDWGVWALASWKNYIFAGTAYGIYSSSDSGNTWIQESEGFSNKRGWTTSISISGGYIFIDHSWDSTAHIWRAKLSDLMAGIEIQSNNGFTICMGDSIILTAKPSSKIYKYLWSTGEKDSTIVVKTSGKYSVIVTNWDGDERYDTCEVIVNPSPKAYIAGLKEICEGDTTVLSSDSSHSSYLWSTGDTTSSIKVTSNGKYVLRVMNEFGCTSSDTAIVNVEPEPNAGILGSRTLCKNSTIQLKAAEQKPEYTYLWSTNETTPEITIDEAGKYYLIVTNRLGCQDTAEVEITESESLVFSISGDSTICNGESTVLSVELGSGYKYKWSTGDTTSSIIINNSGILWVEIENDNGCKGYDTMEVVIFPRPEARIEAVSGEIFCWGDTLRLDALPDNPLFKYSWSTSDTSSQLRVTNYELGINKYWVIVESEYGCKDTAYKDIFVNPVPEFDILGVVEICPGDTSTLSIDKEFSSYIWSTGDTTKDITVTNAGIYFVKVIDTNGCSRYDSVEVRMRDIDISGINDLNFGQIKVGTSKPLQLNIKNSGEEIRIKDVNIKNQPVVFSLQTNPQVPFILNPQGTITITINFSPLEIKNYKDTLIIELDEPCAIKYSSLLEGNSIFGGKLFVSLPDTSGNVNDLNFRIPLKAYIKDKAKVSGLSYKAEIRWDASAFPPDELKSPDIKSNKIENNERVITLEGINVDMDETEREIGSVTGSIFLANQTVTLLRITRFELSDTTMDFEKKDGSIRQVGVCSESIRKISLFQPLEFTLQPNPASDELIITMKGEKGVEYSINLYSSQGEQINKLSVKLEEREIAVKMDVSQLPPGLYFVRIGNGIGMFVKNN